MPKNQSGIHCGNAIWTVIQTEQAKHAGANQLCTQKPICRKNQAGISSNQAITSRNQAGKHRMIKACNYQIIRHASRIQ